jgi:peptidoglycan/LPS O-acetylase OafA/YrhL
MMKDITPAAAHSEHLTHPKYRPDIDGLRAIAILSVVSFHAFPLLVNGGFIGVDIFFVISGFLISTIIIGSLEGGGFSFAEFYVRRINRIFPALILVMIACLLFGWFALVAAEYKQLGKQIAGGAGFVANFLFLNESGYFDGAADTKPLLHLWSLGVEEQFYILWPVLMWFAWKKRLDLLSIALVVGVISFALNVYVVRNDPSTAFYSPQTRFWELMAGSILAYVLEHKKRFLTSVSSKKIRFCRA